MWDIKRMNRRLFVGLVRWGLISVFAMLLMYETMLFIARSHFNNGTYVSLAITGIFTAFLLARGWRSLSLK